MLNHDRCGSASSACLQHFMIQPLTHACTSLSWRLKEPSLMTFQGILSEWLLLGSQISSYDQSSPCDHWIGWHSRVWIRDLHGTRAQALVPRVDAKNCQLNRAKGQSHRWRMLGSLFCFHFPNHHHHKPFAHAVTGNKIWLFLPCWDWNDWRINTPCIIILFLAQREALALQTTRQRASALLACHATLSEYTLLNVYHA